MNRNRWLILGALALTMSVFVTLSVYRVLQNRLRPPEQTIQIVVAAQKLPLGTRLTESSVRLASWPKSMPLEGSFSDASQVIGRGVIVTMSPNEPVLDMRLAPKEGGSGLPSAIPDGMRAVAVKVNDVIGVAGFVLPGTRVDVIMTGTPKGNEDVTSRVILENVQVLAAGQNVEQDANGKPQNVPVITLLVSPEHAQDLALAGAGGSIQLALRNPLDSEQKKPAAMQRNTLFYGQDAQPAKAEKPPVTPPKAIKPKPAPPPPVVVAPAPAPINRTLAVDVFQGQKKETVTFVEKIVK
jgi:pilus assembly protein CpaB